MTSNDLIEENARQMAQAAKNIAAENPKSREKEELTEIVQSLAWFGNFGEEIVRTVEDAEHALVRNTEGVETFEELLEEVE